MDSTKLLLILSALITILLIICVGLLIIVLKKNNSKEYESILSSEKAGIIFCNSTALPKWKISADNAESCCVMAPTALPQL